MAETKEQSKVHRFEIGDKVSLTTDGHDELDMQDEGEVVGFANDEMTYLTVDFDGDEYDLTEDELRRLA
jgi:hypothetical protein